MEGEDDDEASQSLLLTSRGQLRSSQEAQTVHMRELELGPTLSTVKSTMEDKRAMPPPSWPIPVLKLRRLPDQANTSKVKYSLATDGVPTATETKIFARLHAIANTHEFLLKELEEQRWEQKRINSNILMAKELARKARKATISKKFDTTDIIPFSSNTAINQYFRFDAG